MKPAVGFTLPWAGVTAAPDAKIRMRPDGLLELFCVILSAAKEPGSYFARYFKAMLRDLAAVANPLLVVLVLGGFVSFLIRSHSASGQTRAAAEESEVSKPLNIKNVLIGNSAKSVDCPVTILKLHFLPRVQVGNGHFVNRRSVRSQNVATLPQSCRRIPKNRTKRKFPDANAKPRLYIVGGRVSVISYCDANCASTRVGDVKDYAGAHMHIGAQFALSHFPILFVGFEGDIGTLLRCVSGLFGRVNCAPQLVSLIGADEDKKEGEGREDGVEARLQDVQTVLTVFVVALFSFVADFVLELRGWNDLG